MAAKEAETVASISCSGHGRAFLDGLVVNGKPICECNACFAGPDCSDFLPECVVDADSGDPTFLEPFWEQHAASSAIVVAGWHRMSYEFNDGSLISEELKTHIRQVHALVGNAVTDGRFIIFGAGATQLLNAAVHALSPKGAASPAKVVASTPYYPVYKEQTEFLKSEDYEFSGDTLLWKMSGLDSSSHSQSQNIVEFVTSPNNPDGELKKAVVGGPFVKTIHDLAYYWPHFTAIPAPADEDLMIFTLSKLSGHAGSRFGWAIIKDEVVYQRMLTYMSLSTYGVSRETQLRVLKLLKVVIEGKGREMYEFGHKTMKTRWQRLSKSLSLSKRFSIQELESHYCSFSRKVRRPSPAFAWLKCERQEDKDCNEVLKAANIIGRDGSFFGSESRHVRLSLVRSQDDFDLLLQRIENLVSEERDSKSKAPFASRESKRNESMLLDACYWGQALEEHYIEPFASNLLD
ncbi:tryptophan aminotransferase-related protein 4-like [Fagus crenata]